MRGRERAKGRGREKGAKRVREDDNDLAALLCRVRRGFGLDFPNRGDSDHRFGISASKVLFERSTVHIEPLLRRYW